MSKRFREFTPDELDLIRNQPNNGLSVWQLERKLHTSASAIERVANELGVELGRRRRTRSQRTIKKDVDDSIDYRHYGPQCHVHQLGHDPLLAALQEVHGKRNSNPSEEVKESELQTTST